MDLTETKLYGINEEEDWCGAFYVQDSSALLERKGCFKTDRGNRIDIYIKEARGNEPHIHLRDCQGNICRIKLRTNEYQRDSYEKGKNKHVLSKDEVIAFNKYMHADVAGTDVSNWKYLSVTWNSAWSSSNEGKTSGLVNINKDCPDYSDIKEPK